MPHAPTCPFEHAPKTFPQRRAEACSQGRRLVEGYLAEPPGPEAEVRRLALEEAMDALSRISGAGIGVSDAIPNATCPPTGSEIYSFGRGFERLVGKARIGK